MKYDVMADWEINLFCNFNCSYCFFYRSRKRINPKYAGHDIRKIIDAFNNTKKTCLIHISAGGEPFLQPNFIELCDELTKNHYLSLNTNFSTPNVYEFADKINPERIVRINVGLHINQRRDLQDFIGKVKYFQKLNVNIYVNQVMYPPILNNFKKTFQYLKEKGIVTSPRVFRGFYKNRIYPISYTDREKNLFMKYYNENKERFNQIIDPNVDRLLFYENEVLDDPLSFKGIKCSTGKNYVYINYEGNVIRCNGERRIKLGNIFKGRINFYEEAKICNAKICPCPLTGFIYAEEKPSKIISPFQSIDWKLRKKSLYLGSNMLNYVLIKKDQLHKKGIYKTS